MLERELSGRTVLKMPFLPPTNKGAIGWQAYKQKVKKYLEEVEFIQIEPLWLNRESIVRINVYSSKFKNQNGTLKLTWGGAGRFVEPLLGAIYQAHSTSESYIKRVECQLHNSEEECVSVEWERYIEKENK